MPFKAVFTKLVSAPPVIRIFKHDVRHFDMENSKILSEFHWDDLGEEEVRRRRNESRKILQCPWLVDAHPLTPLMVYFNRATHAQHKLQRDNRDDAYKLA